MSWYTHQTFCLNPYSGFIAEGVYAWILPSSKPIIYADRPVPAIIARFKGLPLNYEKMSILEQEEQYIFYRARMETKVSQELFSRFQFFAKEKILKMLSVYLNNPYYDDFVYFFTGHGEGGALELRRLTPDRQIHVTTFGEPRFGNVNLAEYIDKRLGFNIDRVTHADDPIPLFFGDLYSHHNTEYWIPGWNECQCSYSDNLSNIEVYKCTSSYRKEPLKTFTERIIKKDKFALGTLFWA
ncbi:hypothetical protein G9A89_020132 [Geosiphon pyriformis]|nr:hypothetical protein G9A89_020132 [Geosiphon pyriformis]